MYRTQKPPYLIIVGPEYGEHIPQRLTITEINNLPCRDHYEGGFNVQLFYDASRIQRTVQNPQAVAENPSSTEESNDPNIVTEEGGSISETMNGPVVNHFDVLAGELKRLRN